MTSLDERVAKLEQRMESWEMVQRDTAETLREIRQSLTLLHRHEVRIQHGEDRDKETRALIREEAIARHAEINGVGSRVAALEPLSSLNSHGRELAERWMERVGVLVLGSVLTWVATKFI